MADQEVVNAVRGTIDSYKVGDRYLVSYTGVLDDLTKTFRIYSAGNDSRAGYEVNLGTVLVPIWTLVAETFVEGSSTGGTSFNGAVLVVPPAARLVMWSSTQAGAGSFQLIEATAPPAGDVQAWDGTP